VTFPEVGNEVTGVPFGVPLVPTQLIEAGMNALIFASLLWLRKRRAFDGQVMFAYLVLYSMARFTVEFWRDDPRGELLGLSTSQFISVLLFPAGLGLALYFRSRAGTQPAGVAAAQPRPVTGGADEPAALASATPEKPDSKPLPGGVS
jgi:phosphatidylglycerol:prolipoprotein diacylglycerol transferase